MKITIVCLLLLLSLHLIQTQRNDTSEERRTRPLDLPSFRRHNIQNRRQRERDRRSRWPKNKAVFSAKQRLRNRKHRLERNSGKTLVTRLAANIQRIMLSINCKRAKRYLTSSKRCRAMQSIPFEQMRFFFAPPTANTDNKYSVDIPEGCLKDSTFHHAVAVVDPFPQVGFGHLVLIFYIDELSKTTCKKKKGLLMGSHLCLTLAKRANCKNIYRAKLNSEDLVRKCEVNFIPLVYDGIKSVEDSDSIQKLECVSYVAGFGSCLKQLVFPSYKNCDLLKNTKKCRANLQPGTRNNRAPMICQFLATCDHAVLLFGEWNNLTYHLDQSENVLMVYKMLTRNGFGKNNIQLFYGGSDTFPKSRLYNQALPSSDKHFLRTYIRQLCQTQLCVDTLVIYTNGPSTSDGSILLKDLNGNGKVEDHEIYRVNELLDDVSNCDTNHVVLLADQSYSGMLKRALRQRIESDSESNWSRLILLTSGNEFEYSWFGGATEQWSKLSPKHSISWAFENIDSLHSQPTLNSHHRAEDFTIYGAPISQFEDGDDWNQFKKNYTGCQNIPFSQFTMHL